MGDKKRLLYPTVEADPHTKRRNGVMGRVKAWAEAKASDDLVDYQVRTFWSPDFMIFLEPELGGAAVELAHVPDTGPIQWNTDGLAKFGISTPQAANHALVFHSRQSRR